MHEYYLDKAYTEIAALRSQVEEKNNASRRIYEYGASKFKGDYTQAQIAKNALAATGKECR